MAVKVEDMVAELRLTLDKYSAPLKKAEKQAQSSSRKMKRSFNAVSKSIAGLQSKIFSLKGAIVGLGAAIAIRGIKSTLDMADSIGKVAKAAGISTDELQKYQFAAQQSGVKTDLLNKALLGFNIRIGDLKQGRGLLSVFLETYDKGLKKALINTTNTSDALDLMFNALAKVKNGANLASLNMAAFGGSALRMTNLIKDGIGPFRELTLQAERYGIIIDSKFIKAAESTNDKLNIMSKILRVVKTEIVFALIPFLQKMADSFKENKTRIASVTKGLATIATGIATLIAFIGANPIMGSVGIVGWLVLGKVGRVLLIGTIALLNKIRNTLNEMQKIEPIRVRSKEELKLLDIGHAIKNNIDKLKAEKLALADNLVSKDISEKVYLKGLRRTQNAISSQVLALKKVEAQLKIVTAAAELSFKTMGQGGDKSLGDKPPSGMSGGRGKIVKPKGTPKVDLLMQEQFNNQIALNESLLAEERAQQQRVIAIVSQGLDQRNQIERDNAAKRLAFDVSSNRKKVASVLGTLVQITQGSQRSNKKLFQLSKIAGVASATIDAFKGAGKTLGQYPYPIGPILAGVHLATGLANARNIGKQSFTGSVGGGSITGGGSIPSLAATPSLTQPANGALGNGAQTRIEIFVKGSVFNAEVLDEVIEGINERVGNNVELIATKVAA